MKRLWPEDGLNLCRRAHGHLRGLWKAAQLGLSLRSSDDVAAATTAPTGDSSTHAARATTPQAASHRREGASKEASCSEFSASARSQNTHQELATGMHAVRKAMCDLQQTRGGSQQDSSNRREAHAWGELGGQIKWEPGGAGPPATQLLRKLRWVTLGPQFDWSTRVYNAHAPYRPLPPELRALAVTLASDVANLDMRPPTDTPAEHNVVASPSLAPSEGSGRVLQSNSEGRGSEKQESLVDMNKVQGRATQAAACGEGPGVQEWGDWEPDVALVNYYREGDTLGGHRDDAERDMRAPIVALSLGCDAIFLKGGE